MSFFLTSLLMFLVGVMVFKYLGWLLGRRCPRKVYFLRFGSVDSSDGAKKNVVLSSLCRGQSLIRTRSDSPVLQNSSLRSFGPSVSLSKLSRRGNRSCQSFQSIRRLRKAPAHPFSPPCFCFLFSPCLSCLHFGLSDRVTASRPGFTTDLELEELRWDSRTQSPSPGSTDFRGLAEAAATADAQNPQSELDVIHVRREELREMEERLTSQQTKGSPISVGSSPHGVAAGSGSDGTVPRGVGFMDALRIPGVVEYSVGLFFAKLVAYTFLFWLPNYLGASRPPPQGHCLRGERVVSAHLLLLVSCFS